MHAGVTMDDFLRAQKAVGRGCNCASPQVGGGLGETTCR